MNKKPRWRDREGNLYTDGETIQRDENRYVVGTEIIVIPVKKKFPK